MDIPIYLKIIVRLLVHHPNLKNVSKTYSDTKFDLCSIIFCFDHVGLNEKKKYKQYNISWVSLCMRIYNIYGLPKVLDSKFFYKHVVIAVKRDE